MCRVITPDPVGGQNHVDDPLSIAELLRETLSGELDAMTELAARWHMIDDDDVRHALGYLIDARRKEISEIWGLLQKIEDRAFGGAGQGHKHQH